MEKLKAAADCVRVYDVREERMAVSDVYTSLGTEAGDLFHDFFSVNNKDEKDKEILAKEFEVIAGFHPQEIVNILEMINQRTY
ncbi:MAG: hypothetical protein NTY06_00995 [Candidatus Gottesmanbacteria bacterium]|nr:hypothetical protein [Candidatus Gottesmanbacteria bacterium]